jgi:hypothetical protein
MATRRRLALMLFGLLAIGSCDGDVPAPCCPGPVTKRCRWNDDTQQFDKACVFSCGACASDAGGCEDAGAPEARTTYYSNDPRLEACRYPHAAK